MSGTEENYEHREISAPRVGRFNVHIKGDMKHSQLIIMTVHDLGCNHKSWDHFLKHPAMVEIMRRAAVIHVDVPGQENKAPDLPPEHPKDTREKSYTFPSMQSLGEDLVCVLDQLDVKSVVGIGEGAGANIIARFAIAQPTRCLGACLIHCTGTTAGFMESLKDKMIGWKLNHIGMNPTAESYLLLHRFGSSLPSFEKAENKEELNNVLKSFQESLRSEINPHNLNRFVQSFMKRSNLVEQLHKLKCPILMVTGEKASFNHTVHTLKDNMTSKLDKTNAVEFINVEGVANVLEEKPEKLAESFLFFLQGMGAIGGVPMPRVSRTSSFDQQEVVKGLRGRSMSMEEADQPKGIYSSSPSKYGSPPKIGSPPKQSPLKSDGIPEN